MKINRRNFLAATGALGGAAIASPLLSGCGSILSEKPDWPLQGEFDAHLAARAQRVYAKNENPLGPSPLARDEIRRWSEDVTFDRYDVCDFYLDQLKNTIAGGEQLDISQVFIGPGSRDVLAALLTRLRQHGFRKLVMPFPDYSQFESFGLAMGFRSVRIPFKKGSREHPLEELRAHDSPETIIYFSAPHLPYGTPIPPEKLRDFLSSLKSSVVVVDEAYIEFLGENFRGQSAKNLLSEFRSLVVVRTFSKIYGLAGMRVGYALTPPGMKERYFFDHWNYRIVNPLAASLATLGLDDKKHLERSRQLIRSSMATLQARAIQEDESLVRIYPTNVNFYTVGIPYTAKNQSKRTHAKRGIHLAKYNFDYWEMDSHGEFQTTISIRDEGRTIADFGRLMSLLREEKVI